MKKILFSIFAALVSMTIYAQVNEPENNIGKSLSEMQQKYPELRFIGSDEKGDQYMDGYKKDNMATFFYLRDDQVVEEYIICESTSDAPYAWYKSKVALFDQKYYSAGRNIVYGKEYSFSTFRVKLICVTSEGIQTALLIYEKSDGQRLQSITTTPQEMEKKIALSTASKPDGSDIYYTETASEVYGMEAVGEFSASSPWKGTYVETFRSSIKKIQKQAAKKGVTKLLITQKSSPGSLTVKIKATGYQ